MKLPLSWLNDYVKVDDIEPKELAEKLTRAGLQVESIETVGGAALSDLIVVVEVLACEAHPNSDHLHVCKVTDGTAGAQMRLGEGLTLAPATANWGTMPIDMTSDLTISNATDWTYGVVGGLEVSGPGHKLTVDGAGTTTFATAISGYDFDICKKGEGALVLDEAANGLARGTLDLQAGTVAFKKPQGIGRFAFKPGATIALGSSNGTLASLTVTDDVDLDGLTLKAADDAAEELMRKDWTTVLTVPWGFTLSGAPTVGYDVKLRARANADGSMSLQAKLKNGLMLIFR